MVEIGARLWVGIPLLALGGIYPQIHYTDLYLKYSPGQWVVYSSQDSRDIRAFRLVSCAYSSPGYCGDRGRFVNRIPLALGVMFPKTRYSDLYLKNKASGRFNLLRTRGRYGPYVWLPSRLIGPRGCGDRGRFVGRAPPLFLGGNVPVNPLYRPVPQKLTRRVGSLSLSGLARQKGHSLNRLRAFPAHVLVKIKAGL